MIPFSIKPYIWDVFDIKFKENIDRISTAYDMFITNIELGYERYGYGSDIDYALLKEDWEFLSDIGKKRQKSVFNAIIYHNLGRLLYLWKIGNKEEFFMICGVKLDQFLKNAKNKPINKIKKNKRKRGKKNEIL